MKAHEKEEMEETRKRLEKIEKTSFMAQYHAEEAAKILSKRRQAAAAIDALEKEREAVLPKLQKTLEAREAAFLAAKAALQTALDAFQKSKNELTADSYNFSNAIGRQEAILIESADPAIDEAILFFQEKLSWLRSPGRISTNRIGATVNVFKMQNETTTETNRVAVLGAISFCQTAIPALEQMKLTPEVDLQRIQAIKDGIPSIDVFTEISGERPLPKPIDAAMLIPSEESQNYTLGKLHEKVDKLLHPRRA